MFPCPSARKITAIALAVGVAIGLPHGAIAEPERVYRVAGNCDGAMDQTAKLVFQDVQVRILGRWKREGQPGSIHFSPNGYVDVYGGKNGDLSGYWMAERCYPVLGIMDLNITMDINGEKKTELYFVRFLKNDRARFSPMTRSPSGRYIVSETSFEMTKVP